MVEPRQGPEVSMVSVIPPESFRRQAARFASDSGLDLVLSSSVLAREQADRDVWPDRILDIFDGLGDPFWSTELFTRVAGTVSSVDRGPILEHFVNRYPDRANALKAVSAGIPEPLVEDTEAATKKIIERILQRNLTPEQIDVDGYSSAAIEQAIGILKTLEIDARFQETEDVHGVVYRALKLSPVGSLAESEKAARDRRRISDIGDAISNRRSVVLTGGKQEEDAIVAALNEQGIAAHVTDLDQIGRTDRLLVPGAVAATPKLEVKNRGEVESKKQTLIEKLAGEVDGDARELVELIRDGELLRFATHNSIYGEVVLSLLQKIKVQVYDQDSDVVEYVSKLEENIKNMTAGARIREKLREGLPDIRQQPKSYNP